MIFGYKSKSGWVGLLLVLVGFVGLFEIVGLVGLGLFWAVGLVRGGWVVRVVGVVGKSGWSRWFGWRAW